MDQIAETTVYETPRIEDHGDLTELTAATENGKFADATIFQGELVTSQLQTTP